MWYTTVVFDRAKRDLSRLLAGFRALSDLNRSVVVGVVAAMLVRLLPPLCAMVDDRSREAKDGLLIIPSSLIESS